MSGNNEESSRYCRPHNSLFVTVIFGESKNPIIKGLRKLMPFFEKCPENCLVS